MESNVEFSAPALIACLLLDAQSEFVQAADAVPAEARNLQGEGLNTPGWVVAHAGFFHDVWMNVDAQGLTGDASEPWLREWFKQQRAASSAQTDSPFDEARAALDRVVEKTTNFIQSLSETSLDKVPRYEEGAWPPGTTVGYLVARDVAHLFAHASELNLIATRAGAEDLGLPGVMSMTERRDQQLRKGA